MLSYFNVELIRSIHASSDFLKRFTSTNGQINRTGTIGADKNSTRYREGSVTRSVICLIGLFTLCQVPASILHYIYMFYRNHPILYICYEISNFLILVNSAVRTIKNDVEVIPSSLPFSFLSQVNFFIFTYYNRKFRRELARICCQKENNRNLIVNTSTRQSSRRQHSYLRQLQKTSSHGQHLPVRRRWERSVSFHLFRVQLTKNSSWEYSDRHGRTAEKNVNLTAKNSSETSLQKTDSLINVNRSKEQEHRLYDLPSRKPRHSTPNAFQSSSLSARRFTADRLTRHQQRSADSSSFPYTTYDDKSLVIYSRLVQSASAPNGRRIARTSLPRDRPRLRTGHERLRRSRTREIL